MVIQMDIDSLKIDEKIELIHFEDALEQLKIIVEKLETGSLKLDESISLFEKGSLLRGICQKRLEDAKLQISKIITHEGKVSHIESI